jgi:rare lipoprotein A
MNNNLLKQITSTTLTTILGMGGLVLISSKNINAVEVKTETNQKTIESTNIASTSSNPIQEFVTTKIYKHKIKNQNATTLYFQGLPFLTFLDSPSTEVDNNNKINDSQLKAQQLALKLEQLIQNQADANKITVNWDQSTKSYHIKFQKEELVNINSQIILPDTTNNLEVDALQATNRLRRLLGNAAPLSEVAGKPKPKPKLIANNTGNKNARRARGRRGMASWYGPGFHGRKTASGERFNQNALTAAHRSLPFGTKVRVTNVNNGRSVIVRINDRGPFHGNRIIDLSKGAARAIGVMSSGVAPVRIQILGR